MKLAVSLALIVAPAGFPPRNAGASLKRRMPGTLALRRMAFSPT